MVETFWIADRFFLESKERPVYCLEMKGRHLNQGDILFDLSRNRFRVIAIEHLHYMQDITEAERANLPQGYMFDMLDGVEAEGNILATEIPDSFVWPLFDAYVYEDDFIIHGELDIFRVTRNLDIIWSFGARDIFVRCGSNEPAFVMKEDRICLYDFLGYYYEIDYDGNKLIEKRLS